MGKTKISVVGETLPEEEKKKQERREAKKAAKKAEAEAAKKAEAGKSEEENTEKPTQGKKISKYAAKKGNLKKESSRYKESAKTVDSGTKYPLENAVSLLKKFKNARFDETVELHINTREDKVSGSVDLPHGTGKKLRIKIADDNLLADVKKGKIEFDVLVASPEMMPKLAKVARVLGPRGLMPSPKTGTITKDPQKVIEKLESGNVNYKTEAKAPIIHMSIGKKSFDDKKIEENVKAIVKAVGKDKIKSATLTSSQNPGIRLDVERC